MSRILTLVLAVGLAVVGTAGAASAHHNTITGSVACAEGGGWAVTWKVVNSESDKWEEITASNRTVVPVGTRIDEGATKYFTETVTTKPTSPLTLELSAEWSNGYTRTNSGSIAVYKFSEDCDVTTVDKPRVPVIDDCGPGNARYGAVPSGPWTWVLNPDGSLTITADKGYSFPGGKTSFTLPKPTDSNTPCPATVPTVPTVPVVDECGPGNAHYGSVPSGPWTSVLNPNGSLTINANQGYSFPNGQTSITLPTPTDSNVACPVVVTPPPVVTPPEVLPAQVRVVRAKAKRIDKCGRASDLYKVARRSGVIYKVKGKVVREGVWLKAKTRKVVVRAKPADGTYALRGKKVWKMKFTNKPCAQAPEISPNTGS